MDNLGFKEWLCLKNETTEVHKLVILPYGLKLPAWLFDWLVCIFFARPKIVHNVWVEMAEFFMK